MSELPRFRTLYSSSCGKFHVISDPAGPENTAQDILVVATLEEGISKVRAGFHSISEPAGR